LIRSAALTTAVSACADAWLTADARIDVRTDDISGMTTTAIRAIEMTISISEYPESERSSRWIDLDSCFV